jgi:hypothetical protein
VTSTHVAVDVERKSNEDEIAVLVCVDDKTRIHTSRSLASWAKREEEEEEGGGSCVRVTHLGGIKQKEKKEGP